jgi:5-methylcytosine-specific restriction endonuclease McrA
MKATKRTYKEYLRSAYWQEVKRLVLMRDRFTCHDCKTKKVVQVHHLTYLHRGHEKEHLDDLITLCERCHKIRHGKIHSMAKMVKHENKTADTLHHFYGRQQGKSPWCKQAKQDNEPTGRR